MSRRLWAWSLALMFSCSYSSAEEIEKSGAAPTSKPAKQKRYAPNQKGAEALPCPRATYKDDPICFGADDKDALPLPSGAPAIQERPADGLQVKPTANLNSRPAGFGPYQAGVVYQSNGNSVTNSYSGGMKVELPF